MRIQSLGTKLALQITVVITLIMVILGILNVYQQHKKSTTLLQTKSERIAGQLSVVLGIPLWNMDRSQINAILQSYLADQDILSIKVVDSFKGLLNFLGKEPVTQELMNLLEEPDREVQYSNAFTLQIQVTYEDTDIGNVEITFSRQSIVFQVGESIVIAIVILCSLIILETLALLFLVRKSISIPLRAKLQAAQQIADGDVHVHLATVKSSDEIGVLNATFQRMITYLQQMAQVASTISTGDLRQEITPRSNRDVLGNAFQHMTTYLQEIAAVATAIAAGDFQQTITPKTDYDVLGQAFKKMEFLRHTMLQIKQGSEYLSQASEKLNTISGQMATETEQTTQRVRFISGNSDQISQNMTNVSLATEALSASIQEISRRVTDVAGIITNAVTITNAANATIANLADQSQEIGEIVKVITGITQQTNLLALNATIEAARAGDLGKGFAVVASEVKSLARETAVSAENITRKVEAIQASSQEAIKAISDVSKVIHQVHGITDTIAVSVEEQSATTNEMSHRILDSACGSEEVSHAISEMTAVIQNNSDRALAVRSAAKDLVKLADQLQGLLQGLNI